MKVSVMVMLCCDWWRPTCALRLRGCYFTIGGGAFKVHVSENEASQKDVCLADVNLKLHCSLQEEQRGGRCRNTEEKGQNGSGGGRRRRKKESEERRKAEEMVQGKKDK